MATLQNNLYTIFNLDNDEDAVFNSSETISSATWSNNNTELTSFYYDDTKTNRDYFLDVYNLNPSNSDAEKQFSVAFGNYYGCGAPSIDSTFEDEDSATKAIYYSIKHIINQEDNDKIIIDSTEVDRIIAISIQQERLQDKIKMNSLFLHLDDYGGDDLYLIDNSSISSDQTLDEYLVIAADSEGDPIVAEDDVKVVGQIYLNKGLILLNADTVEGLIGTTIFSNCGLDSENCSGGQCDTISPGYADNNNNQIFIDMIQSFVLINDINTSSIIYFVRIPHDKYNHSNNPTYVSNTNGSLLYNNMVNNPFTYITTIGLYNDKNELLAVGKTSQPIYKTYEREALVRVKLTF